MKRYLLALGLMAGCAAPQQTLTGPAIQAALALPPVQFAATLGLAQEVAQGCALYEFSTINQTAIANARGAEAAGNRTGIETERDVSRRSFQAKHGLTVGQDSTCAAIAAEVAEGTALSAVLVPR